MNPLARALAVGAGAMLALLVLGALGRERPEPQAPLTSTLPYLSHEIQAGLDRSYPR